jgi:hypothetical protein
MRSTTACVLEAETLAHLCVLSHSHTEQQSVCYAKCLLLSKHRSFATLVQSALTEEKMQAMHVN